MRTRPLLALSAAALLAAPVLSTLAHADDPKPPTAPPAPAAPEARPDAAPGERPRRDRAGAPGAGPTLPGSVEQAMKVMNRAMRQLKDQVGDAARRDDNLRLIADLQRGCLGAKSAPLDGVLRKAEGAKRDEMAASYRKGLVRVLAKSAEIEAALIDGRTEDAVRLTAELNALRDDGHKAFGVRERER